MTATIARQAAAVAVRTSAYVGLVPYSEADAPFFYGREDDTEIIAANLKTSRLTLLYGPSGVGKSSVLRAGVVPHLRDIANVAVNGNPPFAIAVFNAWREDPLVGLAEAMRRSVVEATKTKRIAAWSPAKPFPRTVRSWTKRVRTLLVILDQFEDYFLYHDGEDGPGTFAFEFPRVVNDRSLRVNVLVSIREDAWAKLDRFEGRIPNLFENYVRVEHLDWAAGQRAITRPVDEYNRRRDPSEAPYCVESDLVDAVLCQVKARRPAPPEPEAAPEAPVTEGEIETPFLQLVMERLWRAATEDGSHELRVSTLDALGGAERIVEAYLLETMATLDESEQDVAAELFRYLVTPEKTKIAQTAGNLAFWLGRPEAEVRAVLLKLSHSEDERIGRILRPLPGHAFEIFHDVLADSILEWRTRHDQEREKAELAARLQAEHARQQSEAKKKLVRWAAGALIVLVAAAVVLIALHQRSAAANREKVAHSRELAALAVTQLDVDPAASVKLAAEGAQIHETAEAEDALRAALAQAHARAILRGHESGDRVFAADISADGKRAVTASADRTARIWSVANEQTFHTLRGHSGAVYAAAFNPDGTRVVTASDDQTARIWDARSGELLHVLRGHTRAVRAAAFSPDGTSVVTAGDDGTARIWSLSEGRTLVLSGLAGTVHAIAFSPDGKRVAAGSSDGTARVWDVRSGHRLSDLRGHAGTVLALAFSANGKNLVTVDAKGTRRVSKIADSSITQVSRTDVGSIRAAALSGDGTRLVTGDADGVATVLQFPAGQTLAVLRGHVGPVGAVAFSSDGSHVISAGDDATARVWETLSGGESIAVVNAHAPVLAVTFSPDGNRFLSAGEDGIRRVWDAVTGEAIAVLRGPRARLPETVGGATAAAFSPDATRVLVASDDGTVNIFDTSSGAEVSTLRDERRPVTAAAFSSDGRRVVTGDVDGRARIFEASTGNLLETVGRPSGSISAAAFSPDGARIVTVGVDGARVFDPSDGAVLAVLRGHVGSVLAATFSPTGNIIVTAGEDRTAAVFDAESWTSLGALRGHAGAVLTASFSPLDDVVVTGSTDGTARVWASSGNSLLVLRGHRGAVRAAAFSPDGARIVTAGDDGTVRVYNCSLCGSIDDLLRLAARVPQNE